jgi:hypothetical protein
VPPLYLTIREGASPRESSPILVSADPDLISSVAKLMAERLGAQQYRRRKPSPVKFRAVERKSPTEPETSA